MVFLGFPAVDLLLPYYVSIFLEDIIGQNRSLYCCTQASASCHQATTTPHLRQISSCVLFFCVSSPGNVGRIHAFYLLQCESALSAWRNTLNIGIEVGIYDKSIPYICSPIPGSGIAPFFQIKSDGNAFYLPFNIFLFLIRLPILLSVSLSYFLVLQWLPIGSLGKKACLWIMIGTPGIWWIDLQIDGVKKGYVQTRMCLAWS